MKKNMDLNNWKKHFKGKNSLLILVLVGLILIVISIPSERKEDRTEEPEETYEEDDYAKQMERRLEKILDKTEGVGNVSVMITLESSEETVVEKDASGSVSSSSDGGNGTQNQTDSSETTVFEEQSDGTQTPYVSKKFAPEIDGVIVVADGGDDPVVIENITGAVKALFDVDMHKIKVMKRKSS